MVSRLRSWWQNTGNRWIVGVIALFALVGFIATGYWFHWGWTGFNNPSKTLWDWLNLLGVLAIPVVVGLGTVWFTSQQGKAGEAANEQQRKTELQIATERI